MIVRILGEAQYELNGDALEELEALDAKLFQKIEDGDEPLEVTFFGGRSGCFSGCCGAHPMRQLAHSGLLPCSIFREMVESIKEAPQCRKTS